MELVKIDINHGYFDGLNVKTDQKNMIKGLCLTFRTIHVFFYKKNFYKKTSLKNIQQLRKA